MCSLLLYLSDDEVEAKEATPSTPRSDDVISDEVTWFGDKMVDSITCRLEPRDLWDKFHELGTEMIITKSGRFVFLFSIFLFCASATQIDAGGIVSSGWRAVCM